MENKIKYIELNENTKISSYLVDGEYKVKGNYHPNIDLPFNKYDTYVSGILTVLNISTDSNSLKIVQYFKSAGNENNIYVRELNGETNNIIVGDWEALTNKEGSGTIIESNDLPVTNINRDYINIDDYNEIGIYNILGRVSVDNGYPILNEGVINARLVVLITDNNGNNVKTQVLTLNNNLGGEGNVYIRSQQNGNWKPWGKLQTNVEVGQITPNDMNNLIDSGIYSGICIDDTIVETFILIVINNKIAAAQERFGYYVSQLKYSIDLNRGNTVKTRTLDDGVWNEWSEIGGIPEATQDTLGGVKLGFVRLNKYAPLVNIDPSIGNGVGIKLDSSFLMNSKDGLTLSYNNSLTKNDGLSVNLGTTPGSNLTSGLIIPCVVGSGVASDDSRWNMPSVGILYNKEQFCLKHNGLNLVDGIASGVAKVTWDANSNMNNYIEPGIYDIYGERTNAGDNLPITQAYNGASIAARLTVVASTLQPNNTEKCVTQFLQLSNRMGGEGNTYIRTYNENNNGLNGWGEWKKQQGMVESYINTNDIGITATGGQTTGLNGMTENGMYSGIYTDDITLAAPTFVETFVLVVINDYAASSQAGTPRRISQLKYATDTLTGQCTVKKRVGTGDDRISWSDWEDVDTRELVEKKDVISVIDDSENPVQSKTIAAAIEEGEKRALRRFYIAAGAEYNDTGADKTKTAPWGDTVIHKAGHYYLNGLGDITEEQMEVIFVQTYPLYIATDFTKAFRTQIGTDIAARTNLRNRNQFTGIGSNGVLALESVCYGNSIIEVLMINHTKTAVKIVVLGLENSFYNTSSLRYIVGVLSLEKCSTIELKNCRALVGFNFYNLKSNIKMSQSAIVSKESIVCLIENASPISAVTITLHPDAYVRLADDADIVAALEAQPFISLVSA